MLRSVRPTCFVLVPTLLRGNAYRTDPAVQNENTFRTKESFGMDSGCRMASLNLRDYQSLYRWSDAVRIPTQERGNEKAVP